MVMVMKMVGVVVMVVMKMVMRIMVRIEVMVSYLQSGDLNCSHFHSCILLPVQQIIGF